MSKVIVIGGGARYDGCNWCCNGNTVELLEKNDRLGKKIFITGKGRCNITNASDIQNHFANIMRNSKFLYSAYNNFSYEDICNMIESAGVKQKLKEET